MNILNVFQCSYEFQEYGVSVENIFAVEPSAGPSYEDIVKMPNKVLLWCGKTLDHSPHCTKVGL